MIWPFSKYHDIGYKKGIEDGKLSVAARRKYVLVSPSMSQAEYLIKLYQLSKDDVITDPDAIQGLDNCVILFYDGGMWPVDTKEKMLDAIRATVGTLGNALIMIPEVQPVVRSARGRKRS